MKMSEHMVPNNEPRNRFVELSGRYIMLSVAVNERQDWNGVRIEDVKAKCPRSATTGLLKDLMLYSQYIARHIGI